MEQCDVAIVGGGIAGLGVAKFLSERDVSFVLFEEHDDFFKKACGEGIIRNTAGYDFYDLYGSIRGIEKEIHETVIHTRYGNLSIEMPLLMTDKHEVEFELARQAKKNGDIRMGERVKKIENGVLLPQKVRPKLIVGADGCSSLVRSYIGLRKLRYGIAAEGYSTDINLDESRCHVMIRKDLAKHGYAWYFPKKSYWNIGIGSYNMKDFKEVFSKFKQQHHVTDGWRGALLPVDKPSRSYGKNAILVGDAASHVVANIGEGIMPSFIAAKLAADCISEYAKDNFVSMNLSLYEKEWRQAFGKFLTYAYYTGNIFFNFIRNEYIRHKLLARMCEKTSTYYRRMFQP